MLKRTLPRHARTGVLAAGWRKPRPGEDPDRMHPIWPILGGAEDDEDDDDEDEDDDEDDEGGKSGKSTSKKKSTKSGAGKDDDEDDSDDEDDDGKDWKAEAEKWRNLSRKHEKRARDNAGAAKERDKLKRDGMTEADKKVDEAVAAARAEERVRAGERVARSAFLAAAKGRIKKAADVVEDVNLKRYVDDETGEVDDDAISELVDRLAPKRSDTDADEDDRDDDERGTRRRRRSGGFDQGARGSGRGKGKRGHVNGDDLFEELLGRKPQTSA